jgi:hypothetical protein
MVKSHHTLNIMHSNLSVQPPTYHNPLCVADVMGITQEYATKLWHAQNVEENMTLSHVPARPSLAPTVKAITLPTTKVALITRYTPWP